MERFRAHIERLKGRFRSEGKTAVIEAERIIREARRAGTIYERESVPDVINELRAQLHLLGTPFVIDDGFLEDGNKRIVGKATVVAFGQPDSPASAVKIEKLLEDRPPRVYLTHPKAEHGYFNVVDYYDKYYASDWLRYGDGELQRVAFNSVRDKALFALRWAQPPESVMDRK
jgi:hypothetical protein